MLSLLHDEKKQYHKIEKRLAAKFVKTIQFIFYNIGIAYGFFFFFNENTNSGPGISLKECLPKREIHLKIQILRVGETL